MKGIFRRQNIAVLVTACMVHPLAAAMEIGDPAPDFLLPGTDGKNYALKDFGGAKILVVAFTCNHCPTSQAYEDRLISIARDYAPGNVALVAISPNDPLAFRKDELGYSAVDDSLDGMKVRSHRKGFPFPYLYDGVDQNCSRAYLPRVTPHVFLFDQNRRLRYSGRIDNAVDPRKAHLHDLRSAIDHVLAGKPIRVPITKVFGCPVKWSDRRKLVARDLARLDRETVSLKRLDDDTLAFLLANKSKLLKLFFIWSPGQPNAEEAFPQLVEIHRRYRKRGLDIITIAAQESISEENTLDFLRLQHASCRNYLEDGDPNILLRKLGGKSSGILPLAMLVAPGGDVRFRHEGTLDMLSLKRAILKVLGRNYSP